MNYRVTNDDDNELNTGTFKRSTSRMSTGAALRASSRAEIGSNMLHRSVSIRRSVKSQHQ